MCASEAPAPWKSDQLFVDLNGDFQQIHIGIKCACFQMYFYFFCFSLCAMKGISNRVWEKKTTDSETWDIYLYLVNTSWVMFHNLNISQYYYAKEYAPNFITDYDVSNQWMVQMNGNINVSNLQILESDCNGIQLEASDVLVPVTSTVTISKIDNHSMVWIKIQFFMAWFAWVYLRSKMKETNMVCDIALYFSDFKAYMTHIYFR